MTAVIILAAGASTRMGQPKQQLVYGQKTLLQRSIDAALGIPNAIVLVVLGANAEFTEADIKNQPVTIVYNNQWEAGMSSSIKAGISVLEDQAHVNDVLLMLCDQPFVNAALLNQLIGLKPATPNYIIACRYNNTVGVPALFSKSYFNELLALNGPDGAKKILMKHADNVTTIPFDKGSIDIDTPADLDALRKGEF